MLVLTRVVLTGRLWAAGMLGHPPGSAVLYSNQDKGVDGENERVVKENCSLSVMVESRPLQKCAGVVLTFPQPQHVTVFVDKILLEVTE